MMIVQLIIELRATPAAGRGVPGLLTMKFALPVNLALCSGGVAAPAAGEAKADNINRVRLERASMIRRSAQATQHVPQSMQHHHVE